MSTLGDRILDAITSAGIMRAEAKDVIVFDGNAAEQLEAIFTNLQSSELTTLRQELEAAKGQLAQITPLKNSDIRLVRDLTLGKQEAERQLADSTARVKELTEALSELADLMDDVRSGNYKPDSYTTQPARAALTASAPTDAEQAKATAEIGDWPSGSSQFTEEDRRRLASRSQPADACAESAKAATELTDAGRATDLTKGGDEPCAHHTASTAHATNATQLLEPCASNAPAAVQSGGEGQPGAENATGEQKISACAQHGDHHDPSCARCAYLANHYRTGLVNLRSEKPQPQAESAPTIEEHFGQPAGSFAKFVDGQQIAPGHNPDRLTNEEVGEGWRLLMENEITCTGDEYWSRIYSDWSGRITPGASPGLMGFTYRRRVTPSEGKGAK